VNLARAFLARRIEFDYKLVGLPIRQNIFKKQKALQVPFATCNANIPHRCRYV